MRVLQILLLSFSVAVVMSATCHKNDIVNGCTVPKGFSWYKNRFRKSCDKHDVCYKCGYTLRVPRVRCDDAFRRSMMRTCPRKKKGFFAKLANIRRTECRAAAMVYYLAVRAGGGLPMYWDYRSYSYCRASWVKKCMP